MQNTRSAARRRNGDFHPSQTALEASVRGAAHAPPILHARRLHRRAARRQSAGGGARRRRARRQAHASESRASSISPRRCSCERRATPSTRRRCASSPPPASCPSPDIRRSARRRCSPICARPNCWRRRTCAWSWRKGSATSSASRAIGAARRWRPISPCRACRNAAGRRRPPPKSPTVSALSRRTSASARIGRPSMARASTFCSRRSPAPRRWPMRTRIARAGAPTAVRASISMRAMRLAPTRPIARACSPRAGASGRTRRPAPPPRPSPAS